MSFLLWRSSFCFSKALTAVTLAVSSRPANPEREWGYFSFCEIWIKYLYWWKQSVETSVFLQSLCFTERSRELSSLKGTRFSPALGAALSLLGLSWMVQKNVWCAHIPCLWMLIRSNCCQMACVITTTVISPPQCPKLGMDTLSSRHGLTHSVLTALWQKCQMRTCQHPGNWCSCFPSWSFICSAEKCPFC